MKIYTGFGDNGDTRLLGGQTTFKNDVRVALCGTLDELNAVFGMVANYELPNPLSENLTTIQGDLFVVGAMIANIGAKQSKSASSDSTSSTESTPSRLPVIKAEDSKRLEQQIDQMETNLKPLTNFLLPGGAAAAATMHLARAICRRAERGLADVIQNHDDFDSTDVFVYLNRLGDWCFVAARFINCDQQIDEPIWQSTP